MDAKEFESKLKEIKENGEFPHFDGLEFTYEQAFTIYDLLQKFVNNYFNRHVRQKIIKNSVK